MARPSKISPEIVEKIGEGVRLGLKNREIAHISQISCSTLYVWKNKALQANGGLFLELSEAIKKAETERDRELVERFNEAVAEDKMIVERTEYCDSQGKLLQTVIVTKPVLQDWRQLAQILEKRYPDRWGWRPRSPMSEEERQNENRSD